MTTATCPDCGARADGAYCAACGQRQPRPGDFSWQRMAAEGWKELSGSDSRIWRTLRAMFVPGELTAAFVEYRWQHYLPPLRLYLILAAVFFFVSWDVWFAASVQQALELPEAALPASIRALYTDPASSQRMGDLTAILKICSVVAMAGWMALLTITLQRPIGAHLVFALHYTAADFFVFTLLTPILVFTAPEGQAAMSYVAMAIGALALGVWAVLAIRRVYRAGWAGSLWRGMLVLGLDLFLSMLAGQIAMIWMLLRAA